MKVKELINTLSLYNPEVEVYGFNIGSKCPYHKLLQKSEIIKVTNSQDKHQSSISLFFKEND